MSASSRSSVTRVNEQSGGSGLRAEDREDSLKIAARNCSGRSVAGGGLSLNSVRTSEEGIDGKAEVEKRKRSRGVEEGGGA